MRYMDVRPEKPNGQTAVVLHGKNFCAATWEETIRALSGAGYRVIAPDQIGWCKSTKPARYQYSFQQLAANTHALIASLGLSKVVVIGHSTGGMLAARFALMYPEMVSALVLVNPIGLEDWKALGVPYRTVDEQIAREKATTAERIRAYERSTYYAGQWRPGIRALGHDVRRNHAGAGARHRRAQHGPDRRHDLHPAGRLRISADPRPDPHHDRRQGHNRHRQGLRAPRGPRQARALSGARAADESGDPRLDADRVSRRRPRAADPGARQVQSRR